MLPVHNNITHNLQTQTNVYQLVPTDTSEIQVTFVHNVTLAARLVLIQEAHTARPVQILITHNLVPLLHVRRLVLTLIMETILLILVKNVMIAVMAALAQPQIA